MKKTFRNSLLAVALLCAMLAPSHAQSVNTGQQLTVAGLLTANAQGSFVAAAYSHDGTDLYLLLNEGDGIRLLEANAAATTLIAQAHLGAAGDVPVAMALDSAGNIYVTGTTTSGSLSGTSGAAFPTRADTSTNSFLAKFSANLSTTFVTFLGAGRTSVTGVAVTADSAFVTGITFNAAFPVTPAGIQQAPASGSTENGFVERFSADGSTPTYATYLTGTNGVTAPAGIVADSSDNATIAGYTTSSGYPTFAALVPEIIGTQSGFSARLNSTGSGFVYSTFIPGAGINGIALDASANDVLLSGNVDFGSFSITNVVAPLTSASYQTLVRVTEDGQTLVSSQPLLPASSSALSVDSTGNVWFSGTLTTPLFPGITPPLADIGNGFGLHVTASNGIDQTVRFGGTATSNPSYSTLSSTLAAPAISPTSASVAFAGSVLSTTSPTLLATQRYDLPQYQTPNTLLPNTLRDSVPANCVGTSQCNESAAYLSLLTTAQAAPALAFSTDTLPDITLRNLGSSTATGLVVTASGYSLATDCTTTLAPAGECHIALSGSGPGSLTVSAANAATYTEQLPATTLAPMRLPPVQPNSTTASRRPQALQPPAFLPSRTSRRLHRHSTPQQTRRWRVRSLPSRRPLPIVEQVAVPH